MQGFHPPTAVGYNHNPEDKGTESDVPDHVYLCETVVTTLIPRTRGLKAGKSEYSVYQDRYNLVLLIAEQLDLFVIGCSRFYGGFFL